MSAARNAQARADWNIPDRVTVLVLSACWFAVLAEGYDIGVLGSSGSLGGRWSFGRTLSANGISEVSNNANFRNYEIPSTVGYAGVTPFIVLDLLSLALYVAFPGMLLWLPNLMS